MKISNRALERMGIEQAEVVYCPVSLDIEVWCQGDCPLKVYIDDTWDECQIGRSPFVEQSVPEDEEWDALVEECKGLMPEDAFPLVMEYAEEVARRLERTGASKKQETAPAA